MKTHIAIGGIVPLGIEQLECTVELVASVYGQVVMPQKGIIGKIDIMGIYEASAAATQIEGGDENNNWARFASEGKVKDGSSPVTASGHYEIELQLHDLLCGEAEYNDDADDPAIYTAYGALVNKKALCEGYSRAM